MQKGFEDNKTIKELGIDITRKFVVMKGYGCNFNDGDILELNRDDDSPIPHFKRISDGHIDFTCLYRLAYAEDEFTKGEMVLDEDGDEVEFICELGEKDDSGNRYIVKYDGDYLLMSELTKLENTIKIETTDGKVVEIDKDKLEDLGFKINNK